MLTRARPTSCVWAASHRVKAFLPRLQDKTNRPPPRPCYRGNLKLIKLAAAASGSTSETVTTGNKRTKLWLQTTGKISADEVTADILGCSVPNRGSLCSHSGSGACPDPLKGSASKNNNSLDFFTDNIIKVSYKLTLLQMWMELQLIRTRTKTRSRTRTRRDLAPVQHQSGQQSGLHKHPHQSCLKIKEMLKKLPVWFEPKMKTEGGLNHPPHTYMRVTTDTQPSTQPCH